MCVNGEEEEREGEREGERERANNIFLAIIKLILQEASMYINIIT